MQKDELGQILDSFGYIHEGLGRQVIICLSKGLKEETRGETTKQIHININILANHPTALARTIVHEASHFFADMPGTITEEDDDGYPTVTPEVYEYDDGYRKRKPEEAVTCADSFAWAALSLFQGRLLTSENFKHELGDVTEYQT